VKLSDAVNLQFQDLCSSEIMRQTEAGISNAKAAIMNDRCPFDVEASINHAAIASLESGRRRPV
jgi:hypothetical protein